MRAASTRLGVLAWRSFARCFGARIDQRWRRVIPTVSSTDSTTDTGTISRPPAGHRAGGCGSGSWWRPVSGPRGAAPPLDQLVKDEVFLDAVIHATRAAQATHQAEKLDALQHAVLHSFGPEAPNVDVDGASSGLVDQFSPGHLRMLSFLADPQGTLERAGIAPEQYMAAGRSAALERLPEFSGSETWTTFSPVISVRPGSHNRTSTR